MYTYLLLFTVILFLMLSLSYYDGDFLNPCSIVMEVFIISISFMITEIKVWDAYISGNTYIIITLGLFVYLIVSFSTKKAPGIKWTKRSTLKSNRNSTLSDDNYFDVDSTICLILSAFSILVVYITYRDIRSISSIVGIFSSFGEMVGNYRNAGVSGRLEVGISVWARYGMIIVTAIAYIFLYIIINNSTNINRRKIRWYLFRLIPIIAHVICSIITGSRNPILQIIIAGVVLAYIIKRKNKKSIHKFQLNNAFRIVLIGCAVLFAFSAMRNIVGRTSDLSGWDYIAKYVGAPIKLFDMFIENPYSRQKVTWGQETFINIWAYIGQKTGNTNLSGLIMNKEYRSINGFSLGNVYTAFREYYADFKIWGVIVLTAIHSFVFSTAYKKLISNKKNIYKSKVDIPLLLYAYFAQSLFYFSIDDRFYQAYLSINTLRTIIAMLILVWLLPRLRIKRNLLHDR